MNVCVVSMHIIIKFIGSFNDATIFMNSDLYKDINEGSLNIPEPKNITGTNIKMPYFFVADGIFALHENVMKPYTRTENLTKKKEIYNYRISRARINVECAFGILTARWRIFEKPLPFNLSTSEKVIMATLLLHNFIISEELNKDQSNYINCNWPNQRPNLVNEADDRIFGNSEFQRRRLADYFYSSKGSVPWQKN